MVASRGVSFQRSAGGEPRRHDVALLVGHLGDIAGRHGARAHRVDLDLMRVEADVLGAVEEHALGRGMHARPERLAGVAHAAAGHDRVHGHLGVRLLGGGAGSGLPRARRGKPRHRRHAGGRDRPGPPGAAFAGVTGIVEMADHRTDQKDDGDDHPVEARREHQRVVIGDHQEDDWQGQIVVVHRALLARFAQRRVGLLAREQRGHRLLLIGDDDDEDIRHHDGADQRADLGEGAAPAEHMGEAVGECDQEDVAHER